jgi:NAD(P)-dependent dehydrogenase (short-subunit alcohol dehydrogenase family)
MSERAALSGKHVVVTGAAGALGGAVVAALIERGATCHLPILEAAVPAHVAWAGDARAQAAPGVSLDDEAAVMRFFAALPPLWGSVHLAGGFAMAPITETALADLERMLAINTTTCFLSCREAVRAIRATGAGGRIVNVAARPALVPTGGMVAYAASKAAVASITQSLAAEVTKDGIWVNAIAPSIIDTPANRAAMPAADHASWPTPAALAETIAFLVSPANQLTSGAIVPVYGKA